MPEYRKEFAAIPGRQVFVYRFGGRGNDWCFVRTPEDYDPNREKPYPFLLCCHGNGWVMDGTLPFANWTKRTMYLPPDDPAVSAAPAQYNPTQDETLWYSNPTVELFLKNGYVVCGCENYGDLLFGNDNCSTACADFFRHITEHYHVEPGCCMLGASNGAQTCLGAVRLLPGRVYALILQYPLTCLLNQYRAHPAHRRAMEAAYGVAPGSGAEQALAAAVSDRDLLSADVTDGGKKGEFPPTLLIYSREDTVVPCGENALAMAALLHRSGMEYRLMEASGEHGDASHFVPEAFLEWAQMHRA